MKVFQVLQALHAGGAEGFVTNLSVSLAELGVDVRVLLMAGARRERGKVLLSRLREAGIHVTGVQSHNVRSPMNLFHAVRQIRSWRPDIVQANVYPAEVLVAIARKLAVGSKACYVRRLASTQQTGYRSTAVVRALDSCYEQTIACSSAVAKAYREFMGPTYQSQLVVIPNGVVYNSVTTTAEKSQARKAIGISGNAFVVAHVGRIAPGGPYKHGGLSTGPKAHDVLLTSFARAFREDGNTALLCVGDGPLRAEAESLARRLGIASQTRFLGEQPEPWQALKAADVFCFPSRYEGLPNALIEAASCGLPVVTSDIPEIRALSPGDAWELAPVDDMARFADLLLDARKHRELYECRAKEAADRLKDQFSMKACAQRYLRAYEEALASKHRARIESRQEQCQKDAA